MRSYIENVGTSVSNEELRIDNISSCNDHLNETLNALRSASNADFNTSNKSDSHMYINAYFNGKNEESHLQVHNIQLGTILNTFSADGSPRKYINVDVHELHNTEICSIKNHTPNECITEDPNTSTPIFQQNFINYITLDISSPDPCEKKNIVTQKCNHLTKSFSLINSNAPLSTGTGIRSWNPENILQNHKSKSPKHKFSYATIDINKTVALDNSSINFNNKKLHSS